MLFLLTGCLVNHDLYEKRLAEIQSEEAFRSDDDGDGFSEADGDCDDADAEIRPNALELCDGVDQDCDGDFDEDPIDASGWWPDVDGDGFGTDQATFACTGPLGMVDNNDDCDDTNDQVFPDAVDVPHDGTDQDCSGADSLDGDGDGHDADFAGGGDCDDADASVHPGAKDACYDGLDADCAGNHDDDCDGDGHISDDYGGDDCSDVDETVYPGALEGWHDHGIDNDCDGDHLGPIEQDLGTVDVVIDPPGVGGLFGWLVGSGPDLTDDGVNEVYIAAPWHGESLPLQGGLFLVDVAGMSLVEGPAIADVAVLGAAEADYFGSQVSGVGDLDGGGTSDLLVSASLANEGRGVAYLLFGESLDASKTVSVDALPTVSMEGSSEGDLFGAALAGVDLDGDGFEQPMVASVGSGAAYVWMDPWAADGVSTDADWWMEPDSWGGTVTPQPAGDVDGDGYEDAGFNQGGGPGEVGSGVVLGGATEPTTSTLSTMADVAFLSSPDFLGRYSDSTDSWVMVVEWQVSAFHGNLSSGVVDLFEDADVEVFRTSKEGAFEGGFDAGWVGPFTHTAFLQAPNSGDHEGGECQLWKPDAADPEVFSDEITVRLVGERPGDRACSSAAMIPDVDGDGAMDFVIGAPQADGVGLDAGRVYVQMSP